MAKMVMPPSIVHLMQHGRLTAAEADTLGSPNMRCSLCAGPTDLIWLHELIADPLKHKGVLPGTAWGKDVAVMCACCSTPNCQHCMWHGELVVGHQFGPDGKCNRCGRSQWRYATNEEAAAALARVKARRAR